MTYKDSDKEPKDYLGKFTKDKVIQNLVGTDKPLIGYWWKHRTISTSIKRSMGRLYYSFY